MDADATVEVDGIPVGKTPLVFHMLRSGLGLNMFITKDDIVRGLQTFATAGRQAFKGRTASHNGASAT